MTPCKLSQPPRRYSESYGRIQRSHRGKERRLSSFCEFSKSVKYQNSKNLTF
ncbi:hypothetical protein Syn1_074 [Prochlorococcus phage Syn1]|uniref:Uncharacterized protein n=1 Tax=Prochlorococcus phage Syn1 TaxID=444861 RepID=E3SPF9_9CAUD|nr:hypothetical protein Syn1_074 [Prochlorococcus phage Syn1]ADO99175.1 hypothetical protein Syn1_074 [Prochlorococcus phage Syn1]